MATVLLGVPDSATQIERIRNRRLGSMPAAISDPRPAQVAPDPQTILGHQCFSQVEGKTKSKNCVYTEHIHFHEAVLLIAEKKADWLLVANPNSTSPVEFHRAIVIRQSKAAVKEGRERRKFEGRRKSKFVPIELRIIKDFKSFLAVQSNDGELPQEITAPHDNSLKAFLREPELMVQAFPEFLLPDNKTGATKLHKKLLTFSTKWWSDVFALHKLDDETRGTFTPNSQVAGTKSPLEYVANLDAVSAHTRAYDSGSEFDSVRSSLNSSFDFETKGPRKVVAANHRAQEILDAKGDGTGQWDYSTGANPDLNEDENAEGHFEYLEFQDANSPEQEL